MWIPCKCAECEHLRADNIYSFDGDQACCTRCIGSSRVKSGSIDNRGHLNVCCFVRWAVDASNAVVEYTESEKQDKLQETASLTCASREMYLIVLVFSPRRNDHWYA